MDESMKEYAQRTYGPGADHDWWAVVYKPALGWCPTITTRGTLTAVEALEKAAKKNAADAKRRARFASAS